MRFSKVRNQQAFVHPTIFMVLGILIVALVFVGYLVFMGPPTELYELFASILVVVVAVVSLILTLKLRRFLKMKGGSPLDPHNLISSVGNVHQEILLNEGGVVQVRSELWSVTSDEAIRRNERVEVVGIEGNVLWVKRVHGREDQDIFK
jgi:membrane protein implicated in regulation of membrane protease activity